MFSWFVSLLMFFGNHGKASEVPSVQQNDSGNRQVLSADDVRHQDPLNPPDSDGTGSGDGHHP